MSVRGGRRALGLVAVLMVLGLVVLPRRSSDVAEPEGTAPERSDGGATEPSFAGLEAAESMSVFGRAAARLPSDADEEPSDTVVGELAIVVTRNGAPAPRARVSLNGPGGRALELRRSNSGRPDRLGTVVRCDDQGHAQIDLPPGRYLAQVHPADDDDRALLLDAPEGRSSAIVDVVGGSTARATLEIRSGSALEVVAHTSSGTPDDVSYELQLRDVGEDAWSMEDRRWIDDAYPTLDEEGALVWTGLEPGARVLHFTPRARFALDPLRVELVPGRWTRVEIRPESNVLVRLPFRAVAEGKELSLPVHYEIRAKEPSREDGGAREHYARASGAVTARLRPGTYVVTTRAELGPMRSPPPSVTATRTSEIEVHADGTVFPEHLTHDLGAIGPMAVIEGEVVFGEEVGPLGETLAVQLRARYLDGAAYTEWIEFGPEGRFGTSVPLEGLDPRSAEIVLLSGAMRGLADRGRSVAPVRASTTSTTRLAHVALEEGRQALTLSVTLDDWRGAAARK